MRGKSEGLGVPRSAVIRSYRHNRREGEMGNGAAGLNPPIPRLPGENPSRLALHQAAATGRRPDWAGREAQFRSLWLGEPHLPTIIVSCLSLRDP